MPPVSSLLVPVGTAMPAFDLPDVHGNQVTSAEFTGPVLVAFLSNHCPYVRHIESRLGAVGAQVAARGVTVVGMSSNDSEVKPEDGVPGLRDQIARAGFTFPYLVDATQQVARDFNAACTPDFFLYDADHRLVYRGAFDGARPRNDVPVTGDLLVAAVDLVLAGRPVPEPHTPSLGCSIKWAQDEEAPLA